MGGVNGFDPELNVGSTWPNDMVVAVSAGKFQPMIWAERQCSLCAQ
jgi:hypothetical protein